MGSSSEVESELRTRVQQRAVVAEVGQQALELDDPSRLIRVVSAAVVETLDFERCHVLELQPGGEELHLRESVSLREEDVRTATVSTDRDTQVGHTLRSEEAVIVEGRGAKDRFSRSQLLPEQDVVSSISVTIGSGKDPWGVLWAHTAERREFTEHDVDFVEDVAEVLATALGRTESERRLQEDKRYLERYREYTDDVLNVVSDVFYILDEDGFLQRWNDSLSAVTGYSDTEIESMHVLDFFDESDEDVILDAMEEGFETGSVRVQAPLVTSEGEYLPYEFVGTESADPEGNPVLAGIGRDVTDRKERNRELAEYGQIVETINDGIYVADEDGHYLMVNHAFTELTGYSREEIQGAHATRIVDESTLERAAKLRMEMVDDDAVNPTLETTIRTADGERVPVEVTFASLSTDDGRERVGVVRDITERKDQRRKLQESEQRYRTLVEHFPNGAVGLFDENLRYTVAGGEILEDIGISTEEVVGRTVRERYPEDIAIQFEPYFRAALAGESNSFEVEAHGRHWLAHTLPVEDDEGDIFAGMVMVQDVTERKEWERALEDSEARFRMLAENLEEMVWLSDPDTRELLYLNPAYETVFGRDRKSVYEDPFSFLDAVHPDDRRRVERAYARIPDEEFDEEYRIVRPDGQIRWLEARAIPVRHEGQKRIVGIAEDITERKERERALEESERRYRTLVEHFPEGAVGLFDENLEYTAAGGELLDEVGVAAEERVGNSVYDIYPDELVSEVERYFHAALEGESNSFETELHGRHLYAHTLPVRNADDEIFAGMLVVQDVTERREYERRLEESNERLEQFAYAASHDLQEPLRMVSSYLQLLARRYEADLDEEGKEFLEYAVDGADRMRNMISGLLEYSRIETCGDPFEPVELESVLQEALADLRIRIDESGAEISAESLPQVRGDPGQLRQVFQNLLDNAIEYSGDDPPQIHVSTERDGPEWVISVRDEGIGIDTADVDRIFEVFQSLHSQVDHEGTGIGLALCERIVERHGGEIWVDSKPGDGSTFSFTLPAAGENDE